MKISDPPWAIPVSDDDLRLHSPNDFLHRHHVLGIWIMGRPNHVKLYE